MESGPRTLWLPGLVQEPPEASISAGAGESLPSSPAPSLTGEVESIVYRAVESDFAVLRIRDERTGGRAVAIGPLASIRVGERVRLSGEWIDDPGRGPQFRTREYLSLLPETLEGLERYLGSGFVTGIGVGLARRLVEARGEQLWQALDAGDETLAGVAGVGQARAKRLLTAWRKARLEREARIFLAGLGLSQSLADRILQRYGERTVQRVRRAPYALAEDIRGIGFLRADEIARQLGIAVDSVARARAALLHLLRRAMEEGHVYLPMRRLIVQGEPLGLAPANLLRALAELEADGVVIAEREGESAEDADRAVYLKPLHQAEVEAGVRIRELASRSVEHVPWRIDEAIAEVEARLGIALGRRQREAVAASLTAPLLTITGGPGTGKTTLVRAILELFTRLGTRFVLAAPTGRAAKRLQETTGIEARTLHRLLEVQGPSMAFRRTRDNPLEVEAVLIDEASMIDLPLFSALLAALPPRARLILVGDVHQLPPVGPGDVLDAVIKHAGAPVVTLDEIYRQSSGSLIALNAQRINRGWMPLLPRGAEAKDADFFFLEEERPESALELIVDLVSRRLPGHYGFSPASELQVLTPSHKGVVGVAALNERLQAALNPEGARAQERGPRLRAGDKVLQSRNNYEKELFNGDIGVVVGIGAKTVQVRFDARIVELTRGEADDLELAYAMTVHKAQGSEFPAVVIPVMDTHASMLRRNLLYTAVTRARRLVVLVGGTGALERAIVREHRERRYSRLGSRLAP